MCEDIYRLTGSFVNSPLTPLFVLHLFESPTLSTGEVVISSQLVCEMTGSIYFQGSSPLVAMITWLTE